MVRLYEKHCRLLKFYLTLIFPNDTNTKKNQYNITIHQRQLIHAFFSPFLSLLFFQGIGSLFSALKVVRLLRLGRVVRKLDRYLEYGAAMLILLLCFYMLVAHWLACIWYSIGRSDADNGVQYSWLWKLANITQNPYSYVWPNDSSTPELINGPSRKTMYVTALYFTMTCMTSVGFGNVAAETDNERIFTICMMIIAGECRKDFWVYKFVGVWPS